MRHFKTDVGTRLNKALAAIEDHPHNARILEGVLSGINFNRKIGQRLLKDETLVEFIQHFDAIPLDNASFEFPDLLGAAYEYLIKYFADSAGKKGGEFYTPAEVDRLLVLLLDPQEGMEILDPTAGSGGMLIHAKQLVEETGGNPRNLVLAGQDNNGTTWAICKMNMILHGINASDIRQGDTLAEPQHIGRNGELRTFDRVIANPPFSQNYTAAGMQYKERFRVFMPEKGKKADLMFVQHMVAVAKANGKVAVIMPHGVLFRGGEERTCRQRFIQDGILEAVIGLPGGLFYGTGIPACVLVLNKAGAGQRDHVLFVNADREYREGKNQNSLRPEDVEKIAHVYRNRLEVPAYSRLVPYAGLQVEEYNLNIRRYVDNSPPPEPQDVRAHLHGGLPAAEVERLEPYFGSYGGVREMLFIAKNPLPNPPPQRGRGPDTFQTLAEEGGLMTPSSSAESVGLRTSSSSEGTPDQRTPSPSEGEGWGGGSYLAFHPTLRTRNAIKRTVETAPGVAATHAAFHNALDDWWRVSVSAIEGLAHSNNVFNLRRRFVDTIAAALTPLGPLNVHEVRGAMANYFKTLEADFKSIAASGWNAELIPDDEILASQFPDVLEQVARAEARIAELQALFASADSEEEDGGESDDETGLLPAGEAAAASQTDRRAERVAQAGGQGGPRDGRPARDPRQARPVAERGAGQERLHRGSGRPRAGLRQRRAHPGRSRLG